MDENKIDKTIEIILQNQAQFYADMQKVQESQKELQEMQKRSERRIDTLEKVASLTLSSVKQTNENLDKLSIKVDKLADAQIETDERLNTVIFMAEKFFSSQNGKSE